MEMDNGREFPSRTWVVDSPASWSYVRDAVTGYLDGTHGQHGANYRIRVTLEELVGEELAWQPGDPPEAGELVGNEEQLGLGIVDTTVVRGDWQGPGGEDHATLRFTASGLDRDLRGTDESAGDRQGEGD